MNNNILQSRPIGTAIFQNQQINIGAFASCGGSPTVAAMLEQSANAKSSSKSVAKRLKEGRRVGGGGHFTAALRAKRRAHFGQYAGGYLSQPAPAAVARRNERERNRVKLVNAGFANLRNQLPDGEKNKKMSKVETLRSAVDYIKQLQEILDEDGSVGVDFIPSVIEQSTSVSSSPARSPIGSASSEPLSPEEAEWANLSTWFLGDEMD